jgi:hypothetical protein
MSFFFVLCLLCQCLFSSSCVLYANVSWLFILHCCFDFLWRLFIVGVSLVVCGYQIEFLNPLKEIVNDNRQQFN